MSELHNEGLDCNIVVERRDGFSLDIELSIAPGETVALLGPNGAGKSTTVSAIAGLEPIKSGRIALAGRVLSDTDTWLDPEDRQLGIVFQDYLLFDHMSVRENVAFGPIAQGRAPTQVDHWLEQLELSALADRRPGELSGGQAQRVALARALAVEPTLLILDEPLAALDVATRARLRRTLAKHLSLYDGARLLITHDPTDAFILADRIAILENGRLTQVGTPDELRRSPATAYAAALAGLNLLSGTNRGGTIEFAEVAQQLATSNTQTNGEVLVTIRPNAIALHNVQPDGSPRNTWQTTVSIVEPLGDTTRVILDDPLALSVDITPGAATSMGLAPGHPVWVSIKATEVHVVAVSDR